MRQVKNVGEIFKVVGGGTPTTQKPEYWRGPIPWATSADLGESLDIKPRKKISREAIAYSTTNLVPKGSVVVATRVGLGKVGIAETDLCFSQDCQGIILDSKEHNSKYIALQLKVKVQIFKYTSRGTTISGVAKKQLLDIPISIPAPHEQHRIVEEIENQFTRLDAGVAALKRIQANLKRYRASVLKVACEGGLIKTDNKQWKKKKFGDVVESMKNGIYKQKKYYIPNGIACLRMYNIENGRIVWKNIKRMKLTAKELNEYELQPGDILINRVNSRELVGKTAPINEGIDKCVFESKNIRARLNNRLINHQYAAYLLNVYGPEYFDKNAQQVVGMASISQPQIANMDINLPPKDHQDVLVEEVERRLSVIEELEVLVCSNVKRADRLRQAILQKAFEGEL